MAAPNLSQLAQKRFEVVRSPDGRITNFYDKQTGRTLSQTEFNNFMQQQAGMPGALQAFEPNSIGSIMGRADEMLPFAQQLGLGQPGVLPLDQQKPNVLTGTIGTGGRNSRNPMMPLSTEEANRLVAQVLNNPAEAKGILTQARDNLSGLPSSRQTMPQKVGAQFATPTPTRTNIQVGIPEPTASRTGIQVGIPEPTVSRTGIQVGIPEPTVSRTGIQVGIPEPTVSRTSVEPLPRVSNGTSSSLNIAGVYNPAVQNLTKTGLQTIPPPPPSGRASIPSVGVSAPTSIPQPPSAGAPPAAIKSWFGKLSTAQKAALGVAGAGAVGYLTARKAADSARKMQAAPTEQESQGVGMGLLDPEAMIDRSVARANTTAPAQAAKPAMPSRAANLLRAAAAAKGQPTPQAGAAQQGEPSSAAGVSDKVPVTTSGKPDYNYYAEMMNAADRNDAYARDLINLKEQARMAAIDAGARGEKFKFVPVKDYMNNRIIFVNAGGNDVVLDMNDPRQGVEYQRLLDKAGVDSATMTDWMHRSSRPMLRYMQPAGGNRDVTPDFGYARRTVEMGEGKPAVPTSTAAPTLTPAMEEPKPTATPSARPGPQPTLVASFEEQRPAASMEANARRGFEPAPAPAPSVAQMLAQGNPSAVEEAKRFGWDYETNEPRTPTRSVEEEEGIRRAMEYHAQNPDFKPGVTTYKTKVTTRRR